jgi:peptidoglycan biosynthesis protein MviN/MurJ (putative lipid II flippase)
MIGVLLQLHRDASWWLSSGLADRTGWLAVTVVAGAGAYFLALLVLGMRPAQFRLQQS